jgi:hypothetical protein
MKAVVYADGSTPVQPGDFVEHRSWLSLWRVRRSRVSYVPGISPPNQEMEYGGLSWVGLSGEDGTFRGVLVDPGSGQIKGSIRFLARTDNTKYLQPNDIPASQW